MTTILGIRFDWMDYDGVLEAVEGWRAAGLRRYITITNPHSVLLCRRDPAMMDATSGAGLTLPDGVGIIWAATILGLSHNGRVSGPTLMLYLCDRGRAFGYRHYFYGGNDGMPERLAQRLKERFPGLEVAGGYSPPFRPLTQEEDREDVARINDSRPDILWVGLGAPKQEKWIAAHLGRIEAPVIIGVGAAFDFHSGEVPWAPAWVRRTGLEWAFRLVREPGRMWRRNLDSPLFLAMVLGQRMHALLIR
jgi:N-acetylglucosaminyldiphosphoundecaprenol N-acetyl-beta-D-mannosaminyltransferase